MADDVADPILSESDTPPASAAAPVSAEGRFSVPLSVVLEETAVPLAKLQGLQQGAVLPLGAAAGAIPVRILASGRPLATGTLVAVGDGYGVLIDDVSAGA